MILDDAAIDTIENHNSSPLFTSPSALKGEIILFCTHYFFHLEVAIHGKSADIWALGVTLFCFVHGHCPFEDNSIVTLYEKIQNDNPVYKTSISDSLRDLLDRMLDKDCHKRITLDKIKMHPWVTEKAGPLPLKEENCFDENSVILTPDEIEHVFKPITFVNKVQFNVITG
jgi:serine/threonine protein kinase